ncbi:MAG TPA: HAMP domain-containing sensor histidine kinase [Candidatus Paceibacterota bacterium]|nr:HAMP domain-containing sensor histidine kinase [Candidatus Paceibacterota bacterium]
MRNILKPFGGKATVSFSERFNHSILRLTILYSFILALILFISSFVCYSAFSHRIVRRFHDTPAIVIRLDPPFALPPMTPTPEELRKDLIASLLLVNLSLLGLACVLSYWLAKKTLEPIKRAYEDQERFMSDVSHELRTPITVLQMDLENELLRGNTDTAAIESRLEEVRNMGMLVGDILMLSRMQYDDEAFAPTAIVLRTFVDKIIARLAPLASSLGVTVAVVEATHGIALCVNETLLSRALVNVIKNAIVYNKTNGTVTITLSEKDHFITIEVVDTGIGIASVDQAHIFDRFYRVDESRTRGTGGSGLGLSIAQSALARLGGTIALASTPGEGTTVTLRFPA